MKKVALFVEIEVDEEFVKSTMKSMDGESIELIMVKCIGRVLMDELKDNSSVNFIGLGNLRIYDIGNPPNLKVS